MLFRQSIRVTCTVFSRWLGAASLFIILQLGWMDEVVVRWCNELTRCCRFSSREWSCVISVICQSPLVSFSEDAVREMKRLGTADLLMDLPCKMTSKFSDPQ